MQISNSDRGKTEPRLGEFPLPARHAGAAMDLEQTMMAMKPSGRNKDDNMAALDSGHDATAIASVGRLVNEGDTKRMTKKAPHA
mgnify:CR=1 FL=1